MFGTKKDRPVTTIRVTTNLDREDPRNRTFSIRFGDGRKALEVEFTESSFKSLRDAMDKSIAEAERIV